MKYKYRILMIIIIALAAAILVFIPTPMDAQYVNCRHMPVDTMTGTDSVSIYVEVAKHPKIDCEYNEMVEELRSELKFIPAASTDVLFLIISDYPHRANVPYKYKVTNVISYINECLEGLHRHQVNYYKLKKL